MVEPELLVKHAGGIQISHSQGDRESSELDVSRLRDSRRNEGQLIEEASRLVVLPARTAARTGLLRG